MKLAVVTNYLSERGGGIPSAIFRLYDLLTLRGVDVVLVGSDAPRRPLLSTVRVYRTLGPSSFGFSPDLRKLLDEESPDVVHLHGIWTYTSVAVQAWHRRTSKPVIVSPHGMVDPWALKHRAFKKYLAGVVYEWANLRNARYIHALSYGEVVSLKKFGLQNAIVQIPNGVDLPKCLKRPRSGKGVLLYLGRLHPKKGIVETLIAWSRFQRMVEVNTWELVIAGWDDGGHADELRQAVLAYDITDSVRFAGPVFGMKKERLLQDATAVILASYSEGLPMTVLEAWSYGKPTFITEQCNLPEGFAAGAAIQITTDPANIADVLAEVLLNQPKIVEAGKAARHLAESEFDWGKISERWLELYRSLMPNDAPELHAS